MPGRSTVHVRLSRLSKLRECCAAIAVSGYRVTSVTRDARDEENGGYVADVILEERPKWHISEVGLFSLDFRL